LRPPGGHGANRRPPPNKPRACECRALCRRESRAMQSRHDSRLELFRTYVAPGPRCEPHYFGLGLIRSALELSHPEERIAELDWLAVLGHDLRNYPAGF